MAGPWAGSAAGSEEGPALQHTHRGRRGRLPPVHTGVSLVYAWGRVIDALVVSAQGGDNVGFLSGEERVWSLIG